jgi:hypothetical protein
MVRSQSLAFVAGFVLSVKIPDSKRKKRFFKSRRLILASLVFSVRIAERLSSKPLSDISNGPDDQHGSAFTARRQMIARETRKKRRKIEGSIQTPISSGKIYICF